MSGSELLKEAKGVQHLMEFVGFGKLPIHLNVDASVARSFMHRRGAGRMKHLDIRHMWLQDECAEGRFVPKKVPRSENPSDMLTKTPSADELSKFAQKIGLFPLKVLIDPSGLVGTVMTKASSVGKCAIAAALLCPAKGVIDKMEKELDFPIVLPILFTILVLLSTLCWRCLHLRGLKQRIGLRRQMTKFKRVEFPAAARHARSSATRCLPRLW